jgi:TolA-binding protein
MLPQLCLRRKFLLDSSVIGDMTTGFTQAMHSHTDDSKKRSKPDLSIETDLAEKIRQLQADRLRHAQAITQIDQVLQRVENALTTLKAMTGGRGADAATQAPVDPSQRPRRHYQKFELTGEESVLEFIRRQGHPTTAEINANWHAEGRTGVANPILARLLKQKKVERELDPNVRGSRYRLSEQPADLTH